MSRITREPYRRDKHSGENEMNLPEGKTCGDCGQFPRCKALLGRIEADEYCDWSPSRFVEIFIRRFQRLNDLLSTKAPGYRVRVNDSGAIFFELIGPDNKVHYRRDTFAEIEKVALE